jgi:hypothetical protein
VDTCLAGSRPWVPYPGLPKRKKNKEIVETNTGQFNNYNQPSGLYFFSEGWKFLLLLIMGCFVEKIAVLYLMHYF